MADGGPVYFETDLNRLIVEPWNAFSSLVLLIPAIYFLFLLRGNYSRYRFIAFFCAPLLLLGGLGSTLFHAFRVSSVFLIMDVFPVIVLTLGVSIYFLYRISGNWWVPTIVMILSFGLRWASSPFFEGQGAININYFITGSLIFIPAILYVRKTHAKAVWLIVMSAVLFSLALTFRFVDDLPNPGLSMGTHWLWHVFSASGALLLGMYLYRSKEAESNNEKV